MRKLIALAAVAMLVVAAFAAPASAGKKKKKSPPAPRTAEGTYDSPAVGIGGVGGACLGANGCVEFAITSSEAYLTLSAEDGSGSTVFMRITQDPDGDGQVEGVASVCGESAEPIAIAPGVPVNVFVYPVGANPPCPGVATSGTVTATFASSPDLLMQ